MSEKTVADDLGGLRDLACQVFSAVSDGATPPDMSEWTCEGIYWDVANTHARFWPEDKAAQLLTDWREQLDQIEDAS